MVTPRDTHGLTTNNAKHGNVGMCQNIKPCTPNEPSKSMVNPMVHPNSSTKKWYQDSHSHGENQIRWNPGSLCVTAIQQCFAPSEHHLSDLQHRWMRGVWKHANAPSEHSQHSWVLDISKSVTCERANSILKFTDLFSWCQNMRTKNKANMSLHQFQLKVIVLPKNNTNPRLPEHHELSTITQKTSNPGPSLSWRLHGARS